MIRNKIYFLKRRKVNNTHIILLVANSSWYLLNYRSLLIKQIKNLNMLPIALAPKDTFTKELLKLSDFIEWKASTKNTYNIFQFIKSFLSLFNVIYKLRPNIIHSHTIKPNLLVSFIAYLLNIKVILSFTGLGILSKRNGFQKLLFKSIIKAIYYFSISEIRGLRFWEKNFKRTTFIFQNKNDKELFESIVKSKTSDTDIKLIPGSGLPFVYQNKNIFIEKRFDNYLSNKKINFLFCARLLKSKGIKYFIDLSRYYKSSIFYVYGSIDPNSKDSITSRELEFFKEKFVNVKFKGFVKNPLLNHLKGASILIVPSNYGEGFPRAIIEAISLGIPVIAFKNSFNSNFSDKQLFITKENNINSLVSEVMKVLKLIENKKIIISLKESRNTVLENFSEEIIVKKTLDIYKK